VDIERRLRDRDADAASKKRLRKLFALAVLATIAAYLLLKYARAIH
jgi:hypothetical protein